MIDRYDPGAIEPKWQKKWDDAHCFEAEASHEKPKFYGLIEFPYPSGMGLHVGHPRSNTALDIICRKRRMEGYNVLYPIGWDAFGLPTENYAIKTGIHPAKVTRDNVDKFRAQLKRLGFSFDWSREVNTTDPAYYKWTQWIFLKLFEKGLAYKAEIPINFCTSCKVGLANEEVVDGVCERCGGAVVRKVRSQWMLKITEYAQRLRARKSHSPSKATRKGCAYTPPGRIRSSARPTWLSPPSIRWWKRSRTSFKTFAKCANTRPPPRANRILSAAN